MDSTPTLLEPRGDLPFRVLPLLFWAYLTLVCATPLAISVLVTPEDIESGRVALTPTCRTLAETGKPCWSCGLTRGFAALGHGRWSDARTYHRGAPWLFGAFWIGGLAFGARAVRAARRLRRETARSAPRDP